MIQVEEEYELTRDGTTYQLLVEYEWINYPTDDEGCPIMQRGDPLLTVVEASIAASWLEDGSIPEQEFTKPYPTLDPPMTREEVREFEEHMCDQSGPDV